MPFTLLRSRLFLGLVTVASVFTPQYVFAMASSPQKQEKQPPNVPSPEKFLDLHYQPVGNQLKLKDDTEFYASGSSQAKKGVILIPDTMGWNAGRIRNIADYLGENDVYAVIPALLGASKEAESGPSFFESHSMGEYMKESTFAHLRPKIHSLIKFLKGEGVEKIALVGFSWGGWVAANILASDLADNFVCGVLPHPSLNLEEKMYGGSLLELITRINRPLLVIQSKSEPADYGYLVQLLKHKAPSSEILDFSNIEGGFVLRGNIANEATKHAVILAMEDMYDFIKYHYGMKLEDLVREVFKSGREKSYTARVGAGEYDNVKGSGKETWEQTKQGAQDYYNKAGERINQYGERVNEAGERMGESWEKTKEQASDLYNKAGERIGQATERSKEGAQDTYNKAGERAEQGYEQAKQQGSQTYDKAKEGTKQAGEQAGETMKQSGQDLKERSKSPSQSQGSNKQNK